MSVYDEAALAVKRSSCVVAKPLVLFDLTRLLTATGRSAPTGLERVEFAYARWLVAQKRTHVRFVITTGRGVRSVDDAAVPEFLNRQAATWGQGARGYSAAAAIDNVNCFLQGRSPPRAPRLGHLSGEERRRLRERRRAGNGSTLAGWAQTMAARWAREGLTASLERWLRRRPVVYLRTSVDRLEREEPIARLKAHGVSMVVLWHDLIPLDFPEFVRPQAVAQCAARLETVARHADGVVAGSRYSADRLHSVLGRRRPPTRVAYYGMDDPEPEGAADLPALTDEPFFLVTSTIEGRKNHQLLLHIWRRLVAEHGANAPKLVIVGRRGWEASATNAMLDRCSDLAGHVYEAGPVADAALDRLTRGARAVLMPSHAEGFGMPVMEALSVGTPVVAADIPAFRETASEAAELIDPLDGLGWARAILELADDTSPRLAAARARARGFVAPGWSDYFATVGRFIEEVAGHRTSAPAARPTGAGGVLAPELGAVPAGLGPNS